MFRLIRTTLGHQTRKRTELERFPNRAIKMGKVDFELYYFGSSEKLVG